MRKSTVECRLRSNVVSCRKFRLPYHLIVYHKNERKVNIMAKRVRYILLTLTDGTQKMIASKTCTESYVRKLIRDLRISVREWEVI